MTRAQVWITIAGLAVGAVIGTSLGITTAINQHNERLFEIKAIITERTADMEAQFDELDAIIADIKADLP